jgi:hypothetical protein
VRGEWYLTVPSVQTLAHRTVPLPTPHDQAFRTASFSSWAGAAARLGRIVLEYLRPAIGSANVEKFLATAPALRG